MIRQPNSDLIQILFESAEAYPMPDFVTLLIHFIAALSGWSLLFIRPQLLEKTQASFMNISPDYLRYVAVMGTSGSSAFYVFMKLSELASSSRLPDWVWTIQSISTAASVLLVHFYFLRILGRSDHAGKVQ